MGDGVIRLPPDQPLRQGFRLRVIARRKLKLESLVENVFVAGVLVERAPVIKRRIVAVARRSRQMAREVAAEQRGAVEGFQLGGGLFLARSACAAGATPVTKKASAIRGTAFFKENRRKAGAVTMWSI